MQSVKPAKLTLTPHHLFYLLSRFEELGVEIGAMNVRIESIHSEQSPANYVSFLSKPPKSRGRSDRDSIHSIGSIRSVMSSMTSFWAQLGMGESESVKSEKARAQLQADTKYLYQAFTKIPCLRLSPDPRARLIHGYEEFPFDTAVPLWAFKNLSALEIYDLDFRQFYGWDRLADWLRSLTIKRSKIDDFIDVTVNIVLDDMDKRRRRSSKPQSSPTPIWPASPPSRHAELSRLSFTPGTPESSRFPTSISPKNTATTHARGNSEFTYSHSTRNRSLSPNRPASGRQSSSHRHGKTGSEMMRRSGSASSNSSSHSLVTSARSRSSTNLLSMGILPASKWRFLRHLSLADNSLTSLTATGLAPLANTLQSLDLSSNLLTEVPDCLSTLTALRALNLANCMIESLHSLARSPLPAISALNLRSNRLSSIAGIERLFSLERLDIRENKVIDPTEMARLTRLPDMREIYVNGNPLVKLHGHYRIAIFNLFRGAPGYTEDILIDASGPGYSERKQLRGRATEAAAVPVVQPPPVVLDSTEASNGQMSKLPNKVTSQVVAERRPMPLATQSEGAVSSNRRKKISKRRIVDLAGDENPSSKSKRISVEGLPESPENTSRGFSSSNTSDVNQQSKVVQKQVFHRSAIGGSFTPQNPTAANDEAPEMGVPARVGHTAPVSSQEATLVDELENLKLSGNADAYRQKVEALKKQFGSAWLHMLSDGGWDIPRSLVKDHSSLQRSPVSSPQVTGQGLVTSGRTIG